MSRAALFATAGGLLLLASAASAAEEGAEPGHKDLSEVVVTAAPYVVSLDSTTTSVNVIKRDALDLAPSAGLGDVLAHLPGVRSSFFGPGSSRPVIRGLAGPRVLVLSNGLGQIDTSLNDQYFPWCENTSCVHALRITSSASSKRARDSAIGTV